MNALNPLHRWYVTIKSDTPSTSYAGVVMHYNPTAAISAAGDSIGCPKGPVEITVVECDVMGNALDPSSLIDLRGDYFGR